VLAVEIAGDGHGLDGSKGSDRHVAHSLSEERQMILLTCDEAELAALWPGKIVPVWRIGPYVEIQSAASNGCSTHMTRPIAVAGHGRQMRPDQFIACIDQKRTWCEGGSSPIYPTPCEESGCTSTG